MSFIRRTPNGIIRMIWKSSCQVDRNSASSSRIEREEEALEYKQTKCPTSTRRERSSVLVSRRISRTKSVTRHSFARIRIVRMVMKPAGDGIIIMDGDGNHSCP